MNSHSLGAFIEIESSPHYPKGTDIPSAPAKAVSRVYHSEPDIELENFQWGTKLNGPTNIEPITSFPTRGMNGLHDQKTTPPRTPPNEEQDGVETMQSFSNPPMNRFRMVSACFILFRNGLNDSAPGALIPYIESHYNIGYGIVSLIFVTNAIGFILSAFFVDVVRARLGRARTLILAELFICAGFIAIICTPPFPVVIFAFFLLGVGLAVSLAMTNTFAANLVNSTTMLGAMHGSYGIGGTFGPLIATAMVTRGEWVWSRFYLLPLGFAVFNLVFAGWSFWHFEAESSPLERFTSQTQNVPVPRRARNQFRSMLQAFKSKTVILGALFIFAYQGAEVSISGWVISFLINTRNGDPSSVGYVTAGFWAGITLGRFLLSHPAHLVGEKGFVYGMVVAAGIFELLVWLVPNVIGDAVAVAIVGLVLGPVYPCATVIFSRAISRKEQVSGLSVISAFGSSGGAVAPFTTGILAQAVGTFILHPIAIGLFAVMLICWWSLPTPRKRTE